MVRPWLVWKQPNLPSLHTQWMTPTQSLEPSEIAIRGDQFTAVLDGQGRYISIRDQRAALNGVTHFHKQVPVCARLGMTKTARGHSTSLRQKANAVSIGVAGLKTLGVVT